LREVREVKRNMATKEAQRAEGKSGMWAGAIVIGIIVGLAGVLSAVHAIMTGGVGATFEAHGAAQVIASGWSALVFSLLGLIGAALWIAKPHLGELILAAAGVAIVFSISMFAVIARPLLLLAALLGRVRQEAQRPPSTRDALGCEASVSKT
jgi:uncharacterized membrane protein